MHLYVPIEGDIQYRTIGASLQDTLRELDSMPADVLPKVSPQMADEGSTPALARLRQGQHAIRE